MAKSSKFNNIELTFFDIAYSLAGATNVDHVLKQLETLDLNLLGTKEVQVCEFMVETYKLNKQFPSWTFLQSKFNGLVSESPIRNMSDLGAAINDITDQRTSDNIRTALSNASALADNAEDLLKMAEEAIKSNKVQSVNTLQALGSLREKYDFLKNAPFGITSGWDVIDAMTAGFQQGTCGCIAGFTSHGKSTISNNLAYRNAKLGKKVAIMSLEITPDLCQKIILSRHSYEMKKNLSYQTIIRGHLQKEDEDTLFDVVEPDFLETVGKNLLILGSEDIVEYSERGFEKLYTLIEEKLGGLDLIIWDHVNQFLYVNSKNKEETGNHYIKYLTDVTKSHRTKQGTLPVTLFVVQCNRTGWKQASKQDGRYDLTALSDFNEIEKSCTYVIFTYADEAMRAANENKMQLLKHRLGSVMLEPETLQVMYAYASVGVEFKNLVSLFNPNVQNAANDVFTSMGVSGGYTEINNFEEETMILEQKPLSTGKMLDLGLGEKTDVDVPLATDAMMDEKQKVISVSDTKNNVPNGSVEGDFQF